MAGRHKTLARSVGRLEALG